MIINQYKESEFYAKYKDTYFSDKILKCVFDCELRARSLYGVNKKTYEEIHQLNIDVMEDLLHLLANKIDVEDESIFWSMIYAFYLDPDSNAIRNFGGIDCTADGLISIKRLYKIYGFTERMISEYLRYRKVPIFFFPREKNGINMTRATVFGDRIDHTLFDIKRYYKAVNGGNINDCKLASAYKLSDTCSWLHEIGSFENLVEWYGIKGIFVNENYEIYDLEKNNEECITNYHDQYNWWWSDEYYNNLKEKIEIYMDKYDV